MSERFRMDIFTGDAAVQIWVQACDECGALVLDGEMERHLSVAHNTGKPF